MKWQMGNGVRGHWNARFSAGCGGRRVQFCNQLFLLQRPSTEPVYQAFASHPCIPRVPRTVHTSHEVDVLHATAALMHEAYRQAAVTRGPEAQTSSVCVCVCLADNKHPFCNHAMMGESALSRAPPHFLQNHQPNRAPCGRDPILDVPPTVLRRVSY
jgi:hypothetical protein